MTSMDAPRFSVGTSARGDFAHFKEQSYKPGVGNYDGTVDTKKNAPKFGFGSTKRPVFAKQKFPIPGPGSYKLPAEIGNTPTYAIPSVAAESK